MIRSRCARRRLPACLALPLGALAALDQEQEPHRASGETGSRGSLGSVTVDGATGICKPKGVAYAEQNDLAYEYEYTPAFAKWQRLLSPEQYEIASRGVSRVMLFSKAMIQAEWEANAPLREAMAIKRERLRALRAKRAAKQCST